VCGGAGEVRGRRAIELDVPAGTSDGDVLPVVLGDREAAVEVSVRSVPDAPIVRYAAGALLVAALAFLGFLLLP
jgi:hypothetical protein